MIAVTITTHKRPDHCLFTLQQLPKGCDVSVFHDKCDSDYTLVEKYCREHGYFYHKTPVHYGKWGFYKLHNLMYEHLDGRPFDHYLQLPDDALMVEDIGGRALKLLQDDLSCVGMFTTQRALEITLKGRPIIMHGKIKLVASNWLDCCFVTTKKVMEGFRLERNWRSAARNEMRSSGVGPQQALTCRRKTGRVAMTSYHSLVTDHTEYDCSTVMHAPAYVRRYHRGKVFSLLEADRKYIAQKYKEFTDGIKN